MNHTAPLRFAAIADIHGNSDALSAVLADIDALGIRTIVNLGDHLSGPLAARETAELLMAREMLCILGNHDRLLTTEPIDQMGLSDRAARTQLDDRHLDWLRSLAATGTIGDDVFLCHGTPTSDTTYWMEAVNADASVVLKPIADIEAEATNLNYPLILCGHTHIARAVRLRDGRLLVNPGSVGCPGYDDDLPVHHVMQTGTPDACYAVLEKAGAVWQVSFRYVPYDSARMVKLAEQGRRPEWMGILASGWLTTSGSAS